jgi:hypothetical protein
MWNIKKLVKKGDYYYALVPEHPKATKNGYVLLHRIVVENHLNRLLGDDEVVHHANVNKFDNRACNLLVTNKIEHAKEHGKDKGRLVYVHMCPSCNTIFERRMAQSNGELTFCSRACSARFYLKKPSTHTVESAISVNTVKLVRKYRNGNAEETVTTDSVETVRAQAEMPKTQSSQQNYLLLDSCYSNIVLEAKRQVGGSNPPVHARIENGVVSIEVVSGHRKLPIAHCVDCGKSISKYSKRCRQCGSKSHIGKFKIVWPSKEEILLGIKAHQSFEAYARTLGVSSNSVRKHLKR